METHYAIISVWGPPNNPKIKLTCPCGWSTFESPARTSAQIMDRCLDHDKTAA